MSQGAAARSEQRTPRERPEGDQRTPRERLTDWLCYGLVIGGPFVWLAVSYLVKGADTDGHVGAFTEGKSPSLGPAFPWAVIGELALVVYAYSAAVRRASWRAVYLGLAVWSAELLWEMLNGTYRHYRCFPFFGFQGQTAWAMYPGLTIEISLLFAMTPLVLFNLLPRNEDFRYRGLRVRFIAPFALGLFCVLAEVLLNRAGALVWTWWFWRWPHLGLVMFVYCVPFILIAEVYYRLSDWRKCRTVFLALACAAVLGHFVLPHSTKPVDSCPATVSARESM